MVRAHWWLDQTTSARSYIVCQPKRTRGACICSQKHTLIPNIDSSGGQLWASLGFWAGLGRAPGPAQPICFGQRLLMLLHLSLFGTNTVLRSLQKNHAWCCLFKLARSHCGLAHWTYRPCLRRAFQLAQGLSGNWLDPQPWHCHRSIKSQHPSEWKLTRPVKALPEMPTVA